MTFVAPASAEGNDNGQCSAWAQTETQEREEVDRAEHRMAVRGHEADSKTHWPTRSSNER